MISSESHESRTEAVYARRHSDRAPGASLHNIFTAAAPAAALTTPQEPHHG